MRFEASHTTINCAVFTAPMISPSPVAPVAERNPRMPDDPA